jgi:hypothetical protein
LKNKTGELQLAIHLRLKPEDVKQPGCFAGLAGMVVTMGI